MHNIKIWDFWADKYEKLWVQKFSLAPTRLEIINNLDNYIVFQKSTGINILDMGCGTGQLIRDMKDKYGSENITFTGIDISEKMIKNARRKDSNSKYIVMDADHFSINNKSYDVILCTHSFPYYLNKNKVLIKFYELLNEGGCLIMAQSSETNFYDKLWFFFIKLTTSRAEYLSPERIRKLSQENFICEEIKLIKSRFFMPSIYMFILRKNTKTQ